MTTTAHEHHERSLLGLRRQPGRLTLAVMRLPRPLYHRGWGRLLGHTFLLIAHQGRKTGKRRETVAMALTYAPDRKEIVVCSAWGPNSEWMRNLRAHPALEIQVGGESWVPEQRFLSEDEAVAVALEFRQRHRWRLRLLSTILGWGDLSTEAAVRAVVRSRPFVAFHPAQASPEPGAGEVTKAGTGKRVLGASAAVAAAAVLYDKFLRHGILTWGATAEEAAASLPGDELLEDADGVATRAITIDALRSAVWPWIAQMGPSPRGGAYTYDWIENLLGLNMHSADRVLPEFQQPEIGDGFGFGANRMSYAIVDPEHVLASRSADGNWVWAFVLEDADGQTRLISRNRFRLPKLKDKIGMIPMEPGSLLMERKMLLGIKQRAERLAAERQEVSG